VKGLSSGLTNLSWMRISNCKNDDRSSREEQQIEKLKSLRRSRNNIKVNTILSELRNQAEENKNLIPIITEAVKQYATIGEICDVLRNVYGEYHENRY
jgi:methylmalonyl-CoA mutase N-terminal domain/subunit